MSENVYRSQRANPMNQASSGGDSPEEAPVPVFAPLVVSVQMALRGLASNKMRAFLTMLGVIIGVGAVIVAIAIGEGSRTAVSESIQSLGTNVLTVRPGSFSHGGVGFGMGSITTMKMEDAEAIATLCPSVGRVSPEVMQQSQVKLDSNNTNVTVYGTGDAYPQIGNHAVAVGHYFTKQDIDDLKRVCVLGSETAEDLLKGQRAFGKSVRIGNQSFDVVGVLKEKGGHGFQNPDQGVYIPVTTAMRRLFGTESVGSILVQARSYDRMKQAQSEVEALLRTRHRLAAGTDNDFSVFSQASLMEAQNAQQNTFSSLITYLAVVSLLVGGIGIMNIMLVSVTERTREIGVRKAIGARSRDVLRQFLLEALFLSLVGGVLGVLFGIGGSRVVAAVNDWRVVVNARTVVLAFSFSAVVGVFFGYYPAMKASRLNPIEALRYE